MFRGSPRWSFLFGGLTGGRLCVVAEGTADGVGDVLAVEVEMGGAGMFLWKFNSH